MMEIAEWKQCEGYRAEWAAFLATPAGKAVFDVASTVGLPQQREVAPSDAMILLALDGASSTGWYQCLRFLRGLSRGKVNKHIPKPWEGKKPIDPNDSDPD